MGYCGRGNYHLGPDFLPLPFYDVSTLLPSSDHAQLIIKLSVNVISVDVVSNVRVTFIILSCLFEFFFSLSWARNGFSLSIRIRFPTLGNLALEFNRLQLLSVKHQLIHIPSLICVVNGSWKNLDAF